MAEKRVIVGFTGTRLGMTKPQKDALKWLLDALGATEFHHGDCLGADAEAARLAHQRGLRLVCHPPTEDALRADTDFNDVVRPAKPYHARNRDIVLECDVLIACCKEQEGRGTGGTWYTIDFAGKSRTKAVTVRPDGSHDLPGG
jgi:hypothetical protein